jgi:hypothetical protein
MVTIEESFELFLTSMSRLETSKLALDDQQLSYEIFEELDIENHSFLHESTIDKLISGGLIPSTLRDRILKIRENIKSVMETKRDINLYRNDPDWKKMRDEATLIISEINLNSNTGY